MTSVDVEQNARTQTLYRDVNDRIRGLSRQFGDDFPLAILCECGKSCTERIEIEPNEYDHVRTQPTHFFVRRGHELLEVERVVEPGDDWMIVENVGLAAEIAIEAYSRGAREGL